MVLFMYDVICAKNFEVWISRRNLRDLYNDVWC